MGPCGVDKMVHEHQPEQKRQPSLHHRWMQYGGVIGGVKCTKSEKNNMFAFDSYHFASMNKKKTGLIERN